MTTYSSRIHNQIFGIGICFWKIDHQIQFDKCIVSLLNRFWLGWYIEHTSDSTYEFKYIVIINYEVTTSTSI